MTRKPMSGGGDLVGRADVSFGSPLEPTIGFSRAVRVGNVIAVAGTAPIGSSGETLCLGDVEGQTRACLTIAEKALTELGSSLNDVIRTRVMLTNTARWKEAAKAHGEFFASVKPACTFVGVKGFIDPDWLVEVEIDAIKRDE